MSTWTNEFDVFRDLDRLSGLKHSNVSYPALNAFGRGKLIVKEDQNGRRTRVAQFSPPPKIPVAQSCPEIEGPNEFDDDSTWDRDRDLYLQLREVCGSGHSNELIEEEFRQMENHSEEQFDDACCHPSVEDFMEDENNKLMVSDTDYTTSTLNKSSSQLSASDTELMSYVAKHSQQRLFVHPPKLKPSRNALLNSLARMKILQLSEEPEMIGSPSTCHERETDHITDGILSNDQNVAGTKLSGNEFFNGHSHCASRDKLETPNMDSHKLEVDSAEMCDQTQFYGEVQKQSMNWADIRKRKVSGYSPVSTNSSDGSSGSPVHAVKSYAATSTLDLPGFSGSRNSLHEERDTSDWKQDDRKKQALSSRASGVQSKSKTKRTKENRCSLPSSPTSSTATNETHSWSSLRQHSSQPKNIMLSDYIQPLCGLGSEPKHNFCEVSFPHKDKFRNCDSLQINSVKDFPPLD